jgi:hypothetical protein
MVPPLLLYLHQLPCQPQPGDMSFICTITLTAELLDGGQQEGAQYAAHQCWQSSVTAAPPPTWQVERFIDNVHEVTFDAKIVFWEPRIELHPVPHCLAFVTGQFFFADGSLVPSLHVRANPLSVYNLLL